MKISVGDKVFVMVKGIIIEEVIIIRETPKFYIFYSEFFKKEIKRGKKKFNKEKILLIERIYKQINYVLEPWDLNIDDVYEFKKILNKQYPEITI